LLAYLSDEETTSLRRLLSFVHQKAPPDASSILVGVNYPDGVLMCRTKGTQAYLKDGVFFPAKEAPEWTKSDLPRLPATRRLIQMLKVHALASESESPGNSGPDYFEIDHDTLTRLARILV
jgi:hypothetical protein